MIYIMSYYKKLLWTLEVDLIDGFQAHQNVSWPLSECRWWTVRTAPWGHASMQALQPRQREESTAGSSPRSICMMARGLHASRAEQEAQVWQSAGST